MSLLLLFQSGGGPAARTGADSLGTTESAARAGLAARTGSDALSTTDAAAGGRSQGRTAPDALATADAASRSASRLRAASDSLGTTDSAALTVAARARAANDALGTSDAASGAYPRAASDALGTSDSATTTRRSVAALDTLGTRDAIVLVGGGGVPSVQSTGHGRTWRTSLQTTISGHQERLRRLELRMGTAPPVQVDFVDDALTPSWTGTFRASTNFGRVYLNIRATQIGADLQIGTLLPEHSPLTPRRVVVTDEGGARVHLAIAPDGSVTADAYHGAPVATSSVSFIP